MPSPQSHKSRGTCASPPLNFDNAGNFSVLCGRPELPPVARESNPRSPHLARMATLPSGLKSITTLLSQTSLDDHGEVLRAADAVLRESRTDTEALHVKVVALLWLDRYEDALGVLEEGGDRLKAKAALEWAYALYKVGLYTDAEGVARRAGGKSRGLSHMGAQTVGLFMCLSRDM
jgi:hypothetical protein